MRFLSFALRPLFSGLPASIFFPMALPASSFFPIALCNSAAILFAMALPASSSATASRPATNLIRRRKYSGLASNLVHLGRIC